jgi:hypothetical protein
MCRWPVFVFIYHYNIRGPVTVAGGVWGMNCLRSLGRCDREFESHLGHGCLECICVYSVCVALYLGRSLATDQSLVQTVLPIVYRSKKNENLDTVGVRYKRNGYKKISRGETLQTVLGSLFRVWSTVSSRKILVYGGPIYYFFIVFQSHFFILSFELPGLTKRLKI